jgi:DNA topoisomerase-2
MFRSEDDSSLEHRIEGNKRVEPEHYVPVIPTILVNGIGTGSMLKKTKFNPKDIIENVNRMLDGQQPIPMNPWFKGNSVYNRKVIIKKIIYFLYTFRL